MPITHTVDPRSGYLLIRRWGHIETHDEARACAERAADPAVVPGIRVLVDTREVEPADSLGTVKYLADCITHNARELHCGPVAILVASDVEYGMARMYMSLTESVHPTTEVFREEAEALAWLQGHLPAS